jgi:hypothetical protein
MRKINFLLMLGLILTFGLTTAFAQQNSSRKPKNMGTLTVKTSPVAYPVRIDNQVIGMSGVNTPAEFYLAPGMHQLEIEGPNGKKFAKEIEIKRDVKNCICLRIVEEVTTRACPYNIQLSGPDRVIEGDLITFLSNNVGVDPTVPVNYNWTISSGTITSGQGTSSITVDTRGMGGQTINADLDVNDGVYDATCRQKISVPTLVERPPAPPEPRRFDEFPARAFDDDKARLDAFAIELQNNPDSQGYIIMYQGTDPASMRNKKVEVLSKKALDYLVKARGIDPRRIVITNWGTRPETSYDLWIIPPGAQPPVPQ